MNTIYLQGVGEVNTKAAGELQDGDVILWDYGYQNTVLKILRCSDDHVVVFMNLGETRKFRMDQLVGVFLELTLRHYKNRNYTQRDYECTNVVCCIAEEPPGDQWILCNKEDLKGLTRVYIQAGVEYFGYL